LPITTRNNGIQNQLQGKTESLTGSPIFFHSRCALRAAPKWVSWVRNTDACLFAGLRPLYYLLSQQGTRFSESAAGPNRAADRLAYFCPQQTLSPPEKRYALRAAPKSEMGELNEFGTPALGCLFDRLSPIIYLYIGLYTPWTCSNHRAPWAPTGLDIA
jgi:hypothetical protein